MINYSDQQIIKRDKKLPGLRILFDSGLLEARLQNIFPEVEIVKIQPKYVRYKKGVN